MALRKPLVIVGGQVEQIQAGDTIAVSSTQVAQTNGESTLAITIGQPVTNSAADTVVLANAAAVGTARVFGLVADASIAAAASGNIQTSNILSSADWTAVVGATTLTSGAVYYLSATAGLLTSTAPTTGFITEVGQANSTTELSIDIKAPVKL